MLKTPEALKGKPFPNFIKKHLIFRAYPEVEKVFPDLGLVNTKEKVATPSEDELKKNGKAAIQNLIKLINERKCSVRRTYSTYYDVRRYCYVSKPESWKEKKRATIAILSALVKELRKNPESFVKIHDNKIVLRTPKEISSGTFSIAKDKDVFAALVKLNKSVRPEGVPQITVSSSKVLNAIAGPPKNSNIVFTSEGKEGLWDIATMSMRGISSCQRWGNSHANCLIGSMIDPYTGIIYLTRGKNKYGSKMTKRAIVRLVLHRKNHKPALMIERIYPHDYDSGTKDYVTQNLFTRFLKKKKKKKYPIVYGDTALGKKYIIPLSEQVESLSDSEKSYRDSHIGYHELNKDILEYLK